MRWSLDRMTLRAGHNSVRVARSAEAVRGAAESIGSNRETNEEAAS